MAREDPNARPAGEQAQALDRDGIDGVVELVIGKARKLAGQAKPLEISLNLISGEGPVELADEIARLPPDWRDHAIASVFALLMPRDRRKSLGAYFTPPHVVDHLISRLYEFGVDPVRHRLRDPAAGGAAFMVPLARLMASAWRNDGVGDEEIVERLSQRLEGREIDPDLATLANALLRRMLVDELEIAADTVGELTLISTGDFLEGPEYGEPTADHEVGNPPFLRMAHRNLPAAADRYSDIAAGRVNLYALFVRRGIDALPRGGVLGYVVPASFLGGPEFGLFRARVTELAEVLAIDIMEKRSAVFLDAIQDTCFLLLRKRAKALTAPPASTASSDALLRDGTRARRGEAEIGAGMAPWKLPGGADHLPALMADWGYRGTIGYLVANRQSERLHEERADGFLPLVWAKSITTDGRFDFDRGAAFKGKGWTSAPPDAPYIIRSGCVAVQRTSSRGQRRRLAAAPISAEFVTEHGGIVAENHVIILVPSGPDAAAPEDLAAALNLASVSDALNRVCGSASISVRLLESLPLPAPSERNSLTSRPDHRKCRHPIPAQAAGAAS